MSEEAKEIIREFAELPEGAEKYILLGQIKAMVEAEQVAREKRRSKKQ